MPAANLLPAVSTTQLIVPVVLIIIVRKRSNMSVASPENVICQARSGENAALPINRKNACPEQPAVQMKDIMRNMGKSARNIIGENVLVVNIPANVII